jgi:hypothetical protein
MWRCFVLSSTPPDSKVEPFVTHHVSQVDAVQLQHQWLMLGGHAKVCKTYLAAELSLAVASGQPALGRLPTSQTGPVLFYGAEDALPLLSNRFDGLAQARGLTLADLPIYLLDVPVLRLERTDDRHRLRAAIEAISPRLLVLDPLVRIARIDENSSADVSELLGALRAMQRDYDLAVLLVHHARKSPAAQPGHAFRGSTDLAAWSDTNIYMARKAQTMTLQIEHRFAPSPPPINLSLQTDPAPHLVIIDNEHPAQNAENTLQAQIIGMLAFNHPMSTVAIRKRLRRRKQDVIDELNALAEQGHIQRVAKGWVRTMEKG